MILFVKLKVLAYQLSILRFKVAAHGKCLWTRSGKFLKQFAQTAAVGEYCLLAVVKRSVAHKVENKAAFKSNVLRGAFQ